MRTQPAITILAAALLLLGGVATSQASTRRQTATPTSSNKPPKSTAPAKAKSSKSKRVSAKSRNARMHLPTAPTPARISEIQSALAAQGAYDGAANGKWDGSTASAMERFQQAHGLNPTGKIDAPTLEKLGLGSNTAGVAAPLPQAKGVDGNPAATSAQTQNP